MEHPPNLGEVAVGGDQQPAAARCRNVVGVETTNAAGRNRQELALVVIAPLAVLLVLGLALADLGGYALFFALVSIAIVVGLAATADYAVVGRVLRLRR